MIEVDQSGKLEQHWTTVIALTNGTSATVAIHTKEKKKIQFFFRSIKQEHNWKYITFALLVAILIKYTSPKQKVIIDTEYIGHESLIASFIRKTLKLYQVYDIPPLRFQKIGKSSPAHKLAYKVAKEVKKADKVVNSVEIIYLGKLLFK